MMVLLLTRQQIKFNVVPVVKTALVTKIQRVLHMMVLLMMRQQRKFNVVAVRKTAVVTRVQRILYVMAQTMRKMKVVVIQKS